VQVCPEQKALPTAERPTCCSGREQRYAPAQAGDAISSLLTARQPERRALRARARLQRASLTYGQRQRAAQRIARILAASPLFHGRKRIALYVAVGTEPDTRLLLAIARRRGLQVCLPRIRNYPRRVMDFITDAGVRRQLNRHGIPEPAPGMRIPVRNLDVVVLPALAFDRRGTRLGTGGGYYDRALAGVAGLPPDRRPWLIGLSYACNELPALAAAPHDVPLDQVATELELIDCHRRGQDT